MKSNIKKSTIAILIILSMLMTSFAILIPVQAQAVYVNAYSILLPAGVTADETYETISHLSFRPTVVGLGQSFLVNMWLQPPLHVNRGFADYTVTITKPDGTQDVIKMDSYHGDATAWFEYVADQVGTWALKFDFPGGYFPAGSYIRRREGFPDATTNFAKSIYYKPSSDGPRELIVQEKMVLSWPESPLPTDYWTRPISPENREWRTIAGNYPWPYANNYDYAGPYTLAPNTAHIVWKRQGADSGLIGGEQGSVILRGSPGNPSIIYNGRGYQTYSKPGTGMTAQTYWQCYDIRTGELYWERPLYPGESAPTHIVYERDAPRALGEVAVARESVYLASIGTRLLKYDPWTGEMLTNVTGMSGTRSSNHYVSTVQSLGGGRYRLINWTIADTDIQDTANFTQRIVSNITWPWSSLGIVDFNAGIAVNTFGITSAAAGVTYAQRIEGASLTTGQSLWNATTEDKEGTGGFFSGSTRVADQGKFAVRLNDGHFHCWDLKSGKKLWVSELTSWPWGIWGPYSIASAYGMIIYGQYDGVAAYDWNTGKIAWHYVYEAPSPYEAPYTGPAGETVMPFSSAVRIADGKVYACNGEHTPSQPIARGWGLHCINATTGEGMWHVSGYADIGVVADGYFTASAKYDGYMYVFGKGKSQTTVTAPDVAIPRGSSVVIKGSVLDLSPAQPSTPCVSKESMATYMEYLHMQRTIDGIWHNETLTGVPVTLTAIGSDDTVIDIGMVTTNGYYGTFSKSWTPPKEGDYEIIASFLGDDSYGSSAASTAVGVVEAPAATVTPTPVQMPPFETYIAGSTIAIIIAIALVGLILKKRP